MEKAKWQEQVEEWEQRLAAEGLGMDRGRYVVAPSKQEAITRARKNRPAWAANQETLALHILGAKRLAKLRRARDREAAKRMLSPEMFNRFLIADLFWLSNWTSGQISEHLRKSDLAIKGVIFRLRHPVSHPFSAMGEGPPMPTVTITNQSLSELFGLPDSPLPRYRSEIESELEPLYKSYCGALELINRGYTLILQGQKFVASGELPNSRLDELFAMIRAFDESLNAKRDRIAQLEQELCAAESRTVETVRATR